MSSYNQRYIFEEPTSPSGIRLLFIHVPRKSLFALYLVFCVSFQQFLAPYVLVSVSFQRLLELPTFRRAANFISLGKYFSNTSVSVSQRILKVGPSLRPTVTYLKKPQSRRVLAPLTWNHDHQSHQTRQHIPRSSPTKRSFHPTEASATAFPASSPLIDGNLQPTYFLRLPSAARTDQSHLFNKAAERNTKVLFVHGRRDSNKET